jgi:UDP-N-acetylglucosamine 1-carboxyvinyltransferase
VGATENIIMAGVLAKGKTIIRNPALEPEVIDLANMLQSMGANIQGLGSKEIVIEGVKELKEVSYRPIPDRIEAGTYMVAAAITGGKIKLTNVIPSHLAMFIEKMRVAGAHIEVGDGFLTVQGADEINPVNIETAGYPAFPTDLQAQFMSLMLISSGTSCIKETVFENRFMHALELKRFGADILIEGGSVFVKGVPKLCGATVMATDLRASVSLILAALTIPEESVISRVYHLDRGYEGFEEKLRSCGADIVRINHDNEKGNQSMSGAV